MMRRPRLTSEASTEPNACADDLEPAAIIRRARRLRFRVDPRAVGELAGAYHAARPGIGLTFQELRPYEPGDDVRHIDWNVTARQDRPYVRRYVEERSLTVELVLDLSASMRFGPPGQSKLDRATQAAALLATAAIANADRVGLRLVTDRLEDELPAATGSPQLSRILRMLVAAPAARRGTDLLTAFQLPRQRSRRSLIVLLSDFLDPGPVARWRRISRGNRLLALRVVEPREEQLSPSGLVLLRDSERNGRARVMDLDDRRVRAAYAHAARQRHRDFQSWCARCQARGHLIRTEEDPMLSLLRLFRLRGRAGAPGSGPS
jgi:uncharacterized protein (DUF58 family)